jgi:hypothetical protein
LWITGSKVEKDSAAMVDDVKDAIEHMERVQRRTLVTAKDIQRNIDDTMEAIDSLLSITSADISEIRLMMEVLLEVYLGKLILVFSF